MEGAATGACALGASDSSMSAGASGEDREEPADLGSFYGQELGKAFPQVQVLAAKWEAEDRIPGLSDLDGRLVCGKMEAEDWTALGEAIGEMHLQMCRQHPEWSRALEHPPSASVTADEAVDGILYHPESRQWSFDWGDPNTYERMQRKLAARDWTERDEQYFLRRFVSYLGPYAAEMDPGINVPPALEERYGLHSRVMHYFVPGIQAALCLLKRRVIRGKRDALRQWLAIRPREQVLRQAAEMLEKGYRVRELNDEGRKREFESRCFSFLEELAEEVRECTSVADLRWCRSAEELRRAVNGLKVEPLLTVFEAARFFRARNGRWRFYLEAPEHFATDRLISAELAFLKTYFTRSVLEAFAALRWGEERANHLQVIENLGRGPIGREGAKTMREMYQLTWEEADRIPHYEALRKATGIYAAYHLILEELLAQARRLSAGGA